jgi:hypothetical protein
MYEKLLLRAKNFSDSKRLVWFLLMFGLVLRVAQYLFNRSLWMDEAYLALNILGRSFSELLKPLDYDQGAPIGFLIVVKSIVKILGNSEYALRLFPLLCGLASLLLFYWLARSYIDARAIPLALCLFVTSEKLIYYSSEVKQYSTDVFVSLLLYVVTLYLDSKYLTIWHLILYGCIGGASIWFSHPSVFVLAGIGTSLSLLNLLRKKWNRIAKLFCVYSIWGLSFGILYFVSLQDLSQAAPLLNYWHRAFPPFPITSVSNLEWFINTFFEVFKDPVSLFFPGIAALTFATGCISMFAKKRYHLLMLLSPFPYLLLASGLHKYPLSGRLLLFIVPFVLLLIAQGAEQIRAQTTNIPFLGILLIILLVFHPLKKACHHLVTPRTVEEVKPVMSHIKENWQGGDCLYIYYGAWPAFEYYSMRYSFEKIDLVVGEASRGDWLAHFRDLDQLRGRKRVWVLFSHVFRGRVDEESLFLYYLDTMGAQLDSFQTHNASAYLYNLSTQATE